MKKCLLFVGLTMAVNGVSGESFEAPQRVAGEAVHGGWTSKGDVLVSTEESQEGDQSVKIGTGALSTAIDGQGVRFIDFQLLPSFGENGTEVEVAGAKLNFHVEDGKGVVLVTGVSGGTEALERSYSLAQGNVGEAWMRISLRLDTAKKTLDVYIDGKPSKANLPASEEAVFTIKNGVEPAAFLDQWFVSSENPLFEDRDQDGMADAEEIAKGLNPFVDDRDADLNGNGASNVNEYFSSGDVSEAGGSIQVLYVDNLNGNDANTGKYSYAAMGQEGPKASIKGAMTAARDKAVIVVQKGTGIYEEGSRGVQGKALTIKNVEPVTIK